MWGEVCPNLVCAGSRARAGSQDCAGLRGFAWACAGFVAGAALSQGRVQILWQAQHSGKVRYRFRGRRSTFARSGTHFASCAGLRGFARVSADLRGLAWVSWQAQHFPKVRYKSRCRRSTFAGLIRDSPFDDSSPYNTRKQARYDNIGHKYMLKGKPRDEFTDSKLGHSTDMIGHLHSFCRLMKHTGR